MKKLLLPLCLLVACSSGPSTEPLPAGASLGDVRGSDYLASGPTVGLSDTAQSTQPTTLQLLEEKARENGVLKARVLELEKSLTDAETRRTNAETAAKAHDEELAQLRALLERSVTEQKTLTDEVVKARIARLRLEQDVLKLKLAEVARAGGEK